MRELRSRAELNDHVLLDPNEQTFTETGATGLSAMLSKHLKKIGLHRERPELFMSTNERRRVRVHDLRGSFVTIRLA